MYIGSLARFDEFADEVIAGNYAGGPPDAGGGIYDIQARRPVATVGGRSVAGGNLPDNCAPLNKVLGCTG